MVELIIDGFEDDQRIDFNGFEDGKFNCCYFQLLAWNIKKE